MKIKILRKNEKNYNTIKDPFTKNLQYLIIKEDNKYWKYSFSA